MPKEQHRLKKLKSPLYCAGWVDRYCLVAGGGGRASTGLPNSVWCIEHTEGGLGEIVTQYDIDGDAPMRMLVSQSKDFLLLAMGFGGLTRVDMDLSSKPPILENHDGEQRPVLSAFPVVNCMSFNKSNRLLAIGIKDGPIQVLDWPALTRSRAVEKPSARAPRDVAFSNAHSNWVISVIYDDGSCVLWDIRDNAELTVLSLPNELKGCSLSRIHSASRSAVGKPIFYASVNGHRSGYLVQWVQDCKGNISASGHQKVFKTAITAFDLSPSGRYLGTGTSDGDIAIFDAQTLLPLNKLQQGHMVFCTAVSFSSREEGLLSVSGDASMRTIPLLAARSMQLFVILFSLVVLLVALILGYVLAHRR